MLASIDMSGDIIIWSITLLCKTHYIHHNKQTEDSKPYDISWCSKDKLIIITRGGNLTVLTLNMNDKISNDEDVNHSTTTIDDYNHINNTSHQFNSKSLISPGIADKSNSVELLKEEILFIIEREYIGIRKGRDTRFMSKVPSVWSLNGIAYLLTFGGGWIPMIGMQR